MDRSVAVVGIWCLCFATCVLARPFAPARPPRTPVVVPCQSSDADDRVRLSVVEARDGQPGEYHSLESRDIGGNHREAMALFDFAARTSSDPRVRAIASRGAPDLHSRLHFAERLQK